MPKDNIKRALNKSQLNKNLNYANLLYEGFGPEKIAIIVEALTEKFTLQDIINVPIQLY